MRDYKQTVRELRDPHFVYHFSRDYLKNMMDDAADAIEELCELVDNNKTAVKHGRWIVVSDGYGNGDATAHICECSECKDTIWVYKNATRRWNYCPNCGAQMDLKEEAETEDEP